METPSRINGTGTVSRCIPGNDNICVIADADTAPGIPRIHKGSAFTGIVVVDSDISPVTGKRERRAAPLQANDPAGYSKCRIVGKRHSTCIVIYTERSTQLKHSAGNSLTVADIHCCVTGNIHRSPRFGVQERAICLSGKRHATIVTQIELSICPEIH